MNRCHQQWLKLNRHSVKTIRSRLILLGAVLALVIIGSQLKAEETKAPIKLSEVPQAVITTVTEAPAKISGWAQSEWTDIKAYQAQGWADAKAQNKANWEKLKSIFNTTKTTN